MIDWLRIWLIRIILIEWLDSDEEFPVCLGPPAHIDTVNIEEKKGTIKVRNYFYSFIH